MSTGTTGASPPPHLTRDAVSMAALAKGLADGQTGAVFSFEGIVRGLEDGRQIGAIIYEAYEPMAEKELARIVARASEDWPVRVVLRHRLGRVAVGEASLVVVCASRHRRAAFEACLWIVERIKETPPIWKADFEWT